jgi:hypothetical protein
MLNSKLKDNAANQLEKVDSAVIINTMSIYYIITLKTNTEYLIVKY